MDLIHTRDGIDTGINGIFLYRGGPSPEDAIALAEDSWGEVTHTVMVRYDGIFYIFDGVDPVTGWFINQNVIDQLLAMFGKENITFF